MRKRCLKEDWPKYEPEILRRRRNKESILKIANAVNVGENFVRIICRGNGIR